MKKTLLELVQDILSSMDSDEVNSISDTTESLQVATIVKNAYYDLVGRAGLPENTTLFQLNASGDSTKPTLMTVPTDVTNISWVRYNVETLTNVEANYKQLLPLPLDVFIKRMCQLDESDTDVGTFNHTVNTDSIQFFYTRNQEPSYYTTVDDYVLIFDSFDNSVDSTLQKSKTLCYGTKSLPWSMEDSFIPKLDHDQFSLLINEAKVLAWFELRQSPHSVAERNSKRNWTTVQSKKHTVKTKSDLDSLPNFGRK